MSRNAMISTAIFVVLLVAVVFTRQDGVKVGVKEMPLDVAKVLPLQEVDITGAKTASLKKEGESWTVKGPIEVGEGEKKETKDVGPVKADQKIIDKMVKAVAELSAESFVTARKEKHEDLQVDDKKGKKVTLKGAGQSLALIVGRSASGGGFFMRRADSDAVFIGKGGLAAAINRDVNGWRQRELLPSLEKDAIASVTVDDGSGAAFSIEKAPAQASDDGTPPKTAFKLAANAPVPEGLRIDSASLGRVAQTLATLRAVEFADGVDAGKAALGTGGKVVATTDDGKTVEVVFGATDDKKRRYAQVKGDSQIYLVSAYARDNLLKSIEDHRDLSLFDLKAADVTRAKFVRGDQVVEVAKEEGTWKLVSPAEPPADFVFDASTVEGKLAGLLRMKASGLAAPNAPAPTAGTVIEIETGGEAPARVVIGPLPSGSEQNAKAVATTSLDNARYEVAAYVARRYEDALALFKKVEAPPTPPGGGMQGMQGLENLPPEIRAQIEAQMRSGQFGR